jgi:hypothetical protein
MKLYGRILSKIRTGFVLAVAMTLVNSLGLILIGAGCESSDDGYHDHGYDHGDTRWSSEHDYYEYYNAYQEEWIPPEEWESYQLHG